MTRQPGVVHAMQSEPGRRVLVLETAATPAPE